MLVVLTNPLVRTRAVAKNGCTASGDISGGKEWTAARGDTSGGKEWARGDTSGGKEWMAARGDTSGGINPSISLCFPCSLCYRGSGPHLFNCKIP
jgi:hypothetical protein